VSFALLSGHRSEVGEEGFILSQESYARKILEKASMSDCNPCKITMEPKIKLSKESSSALVDATMYRSLVGSLIYLMNIRPDLAFSVGFVSGFMQEPHVEHLVTIKHILMYVVGTCTLGIFYLGECEEDPTIKGYSDSGLIGDIDGRKSTTGMLCFFGQEPCELGISQAESCCHV
jgi:hypothetical protein